MRSDRFINIARKYYFNEKLSKKEIKEFSELANEYAKKEDISLFVINNRILNKKDFFDFLSDFLKRKIKTIDDLDFIATSNKENIKKTTNPKYRYIPTTKDLLIIREKNKNAEIFYKSMPSDISKVVAVENMSSFFNLDFELFEDYEYFVYLGGFSNELTKKFLEDKEVLFFVDFDFYGIKIFNSIKAKKKEIFVPSNLEELIIKNGNEELYLSQNSYVKLTSKNSKIIYKLIKKHSKVLLQEILDVN